MPITVGTIVTIKSGGPNMTVTSIEKLPIIAKFKCTWFELEYGHFSSYQQGVSHFAELSLQIVDITHLPELIVFRNGETVQLKSGGPVMTIKSIENSFIRCIWFNHSHQYHLQEADFPLGTLKRMPTENEHEHDPALYQQKPE